MRIAEILLVSVGLSLDVFVVHVCTGAGFSKLDKRKIGLLCLLFSGMQLTDVTERYMGKHFEKEAYDGARRLVQAPDSKWMQYESGASVQHSLADSYGSHQCVQSALHWMLGGGVRA